MEYLTINNKNIEYDKYLTAAELSLFHLPLKYLPSMLFLGYAYIGKFQPEGFTAPVNFYLVKDKNRYFISYRQGFNEAFYYPEAIK